MATTKNKATPTPKQTKKAKPIAQAVADNLANPNAPTTPAPPEEKPIVNHIVFCLDDSGSCHQIRPKLIDLFNDQLNMIKKRAHEEKQETYVSVYAFGHLLKKLYLNAYYQSAAPITSAGPLGLTCDGGSTRLMDAVVEAIDAHNDKIRSESKDVSCLLVCLTDGAENGSFVSRFSFADKIKAAQATDRWTLSFLVPDARGKRILVDYGVPFGNITTWDVSAKGAEVASQQLSASVSGYYATRSAGAKKSTSFFVDLANVTAADLAKLTDKSGEFYRWEVDAEGEISAFVDKQLAERNIGGSYMIGAGFYQLTKPEKLQTHKQIMIYDRKSRKLYGGHEARTLLGADSNGEIRIKIENLATFEVYVQSTSTNRKLVRGSHVLYDKATAKAKAAAA